MTEERGRSSDDGPSGEPRTMGDISHTHPYTNETFGGIYRRGPAVADGGAEPTPVDSEGESSADADSDDRTQTMGEIDHTPRDLNVNNVWDRGSARSVPGDD